MNSLETISSLFRNEYAQRMGLLNWVKQEYPTTREKQTLEVHL